MHYAQLNKKTCVVGILITTLWRMGQTIMKNTFGVKALLSAFRPEKRHVHKESSVSDIELAKSVVARLSRGSHSLQRGHYLTANDMNSRIESLLKHKFIK